MKKILEFLKKETVLSVAWILAIVSMFFVRPSAKYIEYVDFKSLGTLWSLMIIVCGLNETGFFDFIASKMLVKIKYVYQLGLVLVLMPFVLSQFITNDVALLTFVPFAIYLLEKCKRRELLIPIIALQTIAANLGSMLTPIGNPQNLYLYGISGMSLMEFLLLMLPYTLASAILLLICIFFLPGSREQLLASFDNADTNPLHKKKLLVYITLFVLAVLSVALPRMIPYYLVVIIVFLSCLLLDRRILVKIDYALLLTFIGFFILTGNLGSLGKVRDFIGNFIEGIECYSAILVSQFISNVPAALLLSGFTDNIRELIVGVNLGGLGTLIASMASLISFKLLAHKYNELKGRYFALFTVLNLVFLAILILLHLFFNV